MSKNTSAVKEVEAVDLETRAKEYGSYRRKSNRTPVLTKRQRKELNIGKDEGKAILRYARIAPRKVNVVLDQIKNKNIDEAYALLKFIPKAASEILAKLLKSAESNAVNNNNLDRKTLFVAEAYAGQGPTLKRIMPRAQGRAFKIRKRTSHITMVVRPDSREEAKNGTKG